LLLRIVHEKKETVFKSTYDLNILRHSVQTLNDYGTQILCSRRSNETLYIFVERIRLIRPTV